MHHQWAPAPDRHRAGTSQEGSLTAVSFVGSYPSADFRTVPPLPEIAVLGRSNVGKSSLINAVVGRRLLARTSAQPGKTRLCNVFNVAQRFYLVDLPGYGYARVSKRERERFLALIAGYLEERAALVGAVWLLDVRRDPNPDDQAMADRMMARSLPVLLAITKADKLPVGQRLDRARRIRMVVGLSENQCLLTSARTGEGIDTLRASIDALVEAVRPR